MQTKLTFIPDFELIKKVQRLTEIRQLESKLTKATLSIRSYKGWATKRKK